MSTGVPIPDSLVAVLVAGSCLLAVGMCSTTLNDTVKTTPDEAIDLPTDLIPIGQGTIEDIKRRAASPIADDRPGDAGEPGSDVSAPDDRGEKPTSPVDRPDPDRPPEVGEDQHPDSANDQARGETARPPTPLERLQDLLSALLPYLLVAVVLLAILARYRHRILAFVRDRFGSEDSHPADGEVAPSPSNEVARAWVQMLADLGVERDPSKTPGEYALDAIRSGGDRDTVRTITDLFREVRYGGAPVTSERIAAARAALTHVRDRATGDDRDRFGSAGAGGGSTTGGEPSPSDRGGSP